MYPFEQSNGVRMNFFTIYIYTLQKDTKYQEKHNQCTITFSTFLEMTSFFPFLEITVSLVAVRVFVLAIFNIFSGFLIEKEREEKTRRKKFF